VADLRQTVFRQTGHFHDSIEVVTVLQHGAGNFQLNFITAFLPIGFTFEGPSRYPCVKALVRWS